MSDETPAKSLDCPDPITDWEGYCLYQEMFACQACDGVGEDLDDGEAWVCPRALSSEITPSIERSDRK